MTASTLKHELIESVDRLRPEEQRRVLEFARRLGSISAKKTTPEGVEGSKLIKFAGLIEPDDLKLMSAAIEEHCERIDPDEW